MLERTYSAEALTLYQRSYSVAYGMELVSDVRGLMVIRRTEKTNAARRRDAVANWQVWNLVVAETAYLLLALLSRPLYSLTSLPHWFKIEDYRPILSHFLTPLNLTVCVT